MAHKLIIPLSSGVDSADEVDVTIEEFGEFLQCNDTSEKSLSVLADKGDTTSQKRKTTPSRSRGKQHKRPNQIISDNSRQTPSSRSGPASNSTMASKQDMKKLAEKIDLTLSKVNDISPIVAEMKLAYDN